MLGFEVYVAKTENWQKMWKKSHTICYGQGDYRKGTYLQYLTRK